MFDLSKSRGLLVGRRYKHAHIHTAGVCGELCLNEKVKVVLVSD